MERLLPSLEPETYRSWAKALAITPKIAVFRLTRITWRAPNKLSKMEVVRLSIVQMLTVRSHKSSPIQAVNKRGLNLGPIR
ncbi:hypothetical protein DVH24_015679 [Malus domestica]|uniref:Uncharacterized protein n=1 Tax=Malus domestica TaxID=3750 RepID=A0A498HNR7_MALDO|nr:hypothetical protein DVH24_015679 [Malus domestica]